jgi:hypothetical protein
VRAAAWSACLIWPLAAAAAPSEIKVFTDELAAPGAHTLELHANKAASRLQLMPEYSYGVAQGWELSLQLPLAYQDASLSAAGYRAELQYVAPHDASQGAYWGFNLELARITASGEPRFWDLEMMPILGWRSGSWHLAANPGLTLALSGPERRLRFAPAAKAAYSSSEKSAWGVEYYLDAGPLRNWLPRDQRAELLFLAWDGKVGKSDINLGLGRGLTGATDRWVLKTIVEFAF